MHRYFPYFLLFFFLFSVSCKTSQPKRPEELYLTPSALPFSSIRLPLTVGLDDLEKVINTQIDDLITSGDALPDDYGDGLKMTVRKTNSVQLSADGHVIFFEVPLGLQVEKDINIATAKADGEITLKFQTDFAFDEHWNIKTNTAITNHKWVKKPTLDLGIIRLPVEGMANQLINRSKATLTQQIDEQLQARFALKDYAKLALDTLQQPILVSEEYDAWLAIRPQRVTMAPLQTIDREVNTTILLELTTDVALGGSNNFSTLITAMPPLLENDISGEGFQIYFQTKVPYPIIEATAKESLVGEVYEDGKKKIKIEDIEIFGQKDKMIINATLSGSYNGSIYLMGEPVYNAQKEQLELAKLDFELNTKHFLQKSMAWLLKRNIKKQLQESLVYPIKDEMATLQTTFETEMKQLVNHPQVLVESEVDKLDIPKLFVEKEHLLVVVLASGEINATIKQLNLEW